MTITPEQLDEWKRLAGAAAKAAPGDWDTDTIDNDGGGSGHFDSYCVFIAGKPGEIGKGIVDTLNSDNISVEVDVDEDGIRAWDENGRRVVEYIAAFDPPATLALIAEVERLNAEAARLEGEKSKLREALSGAVQCFDNLMSDSGGVYGLHLNGDPAPWSELTSGGHFEDWTTEIDDARLALAETGEKP